MQGSDLSLSTIQVRIYAVKKEDNLGRDHKSANAFIGGKKKKRNQLTSHLGDKQKKKRKA